MSLTCVPRHVSQCVRVLRPCFRHRHHLVFTWLLVLHLVYGSRANVRALARHGPSHLAYQHYRRLICAAYWCTKTLLWWFAEQAMGAFPPPDDGLLYLVGDSTLKGKRGAKHPVAHKTRLSQHHPYVFGFRIVVLMAQWHVYRIPIDFALVRRKGSPGYQTENVLFRQMVRDFKPPAWCREVIVVADAAYASRANLRLIQELGYWYVCAIARTWKFHDGKRLTALVTHLPRWHYQRIRLPTVNGQRRRTFWVFAKRTQLQHVGDVTMVLSKCRQTDGPKHTKLLVTNLPDTVSARQIVAIYLRRWWVELLFRELKGVVGVGQHQVTKDVGRVERSVAIAIMAYLFLLRLKASEVPADRPWSAFTLQRAFAWELIEEQCSRSAKRLTRKWLQRKEAA
jgi:Transposase DDE domain